MLQRGSNTGDPMDGKNTKTMILVAVVIAVIVCAAAAYYLLQDDEPQDGANHQTLDMPDTLLVIPAPGTGETYTGTINIDNPMSPDIVVGVTVDYVDYLGGQDRYRIGFDISGTDLQIRSLDIVADIERGGLTGGPMNVWDGYDTSAPVELDGSGSTLDYDVTMADGYRVSVVTPGMGTEVTVDSSDGWFEVGVDDGLYAVKVHVTAVYEYFTGDTYTVNAELDIWLPGEYRETA